MNMNIEEVKTNSTDIEDLARKILGIPNDSDLTDREVEAELMEEFNIEFDYFQRIIGRLLPLIDVGNSPLTGERFKGFSDNQCWLISMPIETK